MTKEKLFLVAENNFDKLNAFNWKKEEKKEKKNFVHVD